MRIILAGCLSLTLALAACGRSDDSSAVRNEIEAHAQRDAAAAQAAGQSSGHFLDDARARPGAITLPSGLTYVYTHHSSNQGLAKPPANAQVLVHYEGKLADGTVFDSSFQRGQPAAFALDQVVPGFTQVIQQMRPGDEVIATFPPALGYGEAGQPPIIPPNSALQFRI